MQYSYLSNSHLLSGWTNSAGGVQVVRAFETHRDLLTSVENRAGTNIISRFDYFNDELARRTHRVDNSTMTNDFGYNSRSELISALMGTNQYGWVLDNIGNRQSYTNNNYIKQYTANQLNQYTKITNGSLINLTYDADGNLTNDSVFAYTWDAENRLILVEPIAPTSGTQRVRCAYDFMCRRFEKAVDTWNGSTWANNSTNRFVWNGWLLIAEQASAFTNYWVNGLDLSGALHGGGGIGGLVAWSHGTTNVLYFGDANGNITDLVDAGNPINIVAHYEWDPYGNMISSSGSLTTVNHLLWSSKYWDAETGLGYWGYRWYNGSRWISRDVLGENIDTPNLCLGMRNAPIDHIDPLGFAAPTTSGIVADPGKTRTFKILPKEVTIPALRNGVDDLVEKCGGTLSVEAYVAGTMNNDQEGYHVPKDWQVFFDQNVPREWGWSGAKVSGAMNVFAKFEWTKLPAVPCYCPKVGFIQSIRHNPTEEWRIDGSVFGLYYQSLGGPNAIAQPAETASWYPDGTPRKWLFDDPAYHVYFEAKTTVHVVNKKNIPGKTLAEFSWGYRTKKVGSIEIHEPIYDIDVTVDLKQVYDAYIK